MMASHAGQCTYSYEEQTPPKVMKLPTVLAELEFGILNSAITPEVIPLPRLYREVSNISILFSFKGQSSFKTQL